jgi:hypothetical protein
LAASYLEDIIDKESPDIPREEESPHLNYGQAASGLVLFQRKNHGPARGHACTGDKSISGSSRSIAWDAGQPALKVPGVASLTDPAWVTLGNFLVRLLDLAVKHGCSEIVLSPLARRLAPASDESVSPRNRVMSQPDCARDSVPRREPLGMMAKLWARSR